MAPRSSVKDVKSNIRRGGRHPADLEVERADAKVNSPESAVDESAQEAPKQNKPKRGKVAELTKLLEEAKKRAQQAEEQVQQQQKRIKDLEAEGKQKSEGIQILNDNLRDQTQAYKNRIAELEDSNKVYINGAKSLINRKKEADEKNERLSKNYQDALTQNSILTESIRQSALKSPEEVAQAQEAFKSASEPKVDNSAKAEEVKTDNSEEDLSSSRDVGAEWLEIAKALNEGRLSDAQKLADQAAKKYGYTSEPKATNSGTTEKTVTPKTGEAKVEGEPKVNTEQTQTTQEPAKEVNTRPGTGEATADNMMTPEDAYNYFKNKDNYEKASNVFETPSFNEYIDSNTGKWIPRGYFDAYNAKDGINPKKFTFEHFKAKIPEDLSKKLTSAEATEELAKRNAALKSYDEEYKKFNTGFKAYLRKHPKLEKILKTGKVAGGIGILYGLGQMLNDTYMAGQNDKDKHQMTVESLDDDAPEYPGAIATNNNINPDNVTAKLKGADESTETPEDNSGTIEQAIAEQAPAGTVEPENPQVAANAATPTNTKANNAPASAAKSAPTQGLPPVVTRDAPPANPDSSGMTYSQRVEAGQAPQAGSMAYNANNPDMVTAGLIDAMNQNSQAGSDAIGYGDLYDQNFIDFWAKRNPNLAYAVSQGRKS